MWCAVAWQAIVPEALGSGVCAVGRVLQHPRMGALTRALSDSLHSAELAETKRCVHLLCSLLSFHAGILPMCALFDVSRSAVFLMPLQVFK